VGKALPSITDWGHLDQEYRLIAHIDQETCISCGLCYAACNDGAHQAIFKSGSNGTTRLHVEEEHCVGCRLCEYACPVPGTIEFEARDEPAPIH
jgi:dihydropyrimidine dehydrogenase (NAD+) subunit PreA